MCAKQSASKYTKQQLTELKGETNKLMIVTKLIIVSKPQKLIYKEKKKKKMSRDIKAMNN